MEKTETIIDLINQITNNDYKFLLKSATLDESADFCLIEIFYRDGIILDKEVKQKVEDKILEVAPKKYTYKIIFIKNFISEERVAGDIREFMDGNFSAIYYKLEKVNAEAMNFNIEMTIDKMSYDYAIQKNLKNLIESKLKKMYEDYTFFVKLEQGVVYKKDEKQELINSYKEEEVDEGLFRKIDVTDIVPLVNNEITGSARYIMDKKKPEDNVVLCGKIKAIKSIVIKKKPKAEEVENPENNAETLSLEKEDEVASKENVGSETSADERSKLDKNVNSENLEQTEKSSEKETEKEDDTTKYERKLYKWSLQDFTGQIGCVFMSNKENQPKLEGLADETEILVCGKIEKDNYSGDTVMRVHDISLCKIPEDLKEYIVFKKEKPFYEFIEPEPLIIYEQDNLMNFAEEKEVPKYLQNKTFVCYDLETTGLHYERGDRMVEIGAIKIENGKITEKFGTYVNPNGKHIDEKASETTGIYDSDVENAPKDYQVLQDFYKFTRGAILIGYNNVNFDNTFLIGQGKACKWNFDNPTEDVFKYAQKLVHGVKNYKLGTIAEKLGVVLDNAHSAVYDALATAQVFLKLAENIDC